MPANPRYANGHRRRQLRARILREETTCAICHQPVDTSLPHGQPDSPEIDEIIPISLGGNPLDRNMCQLTHRKCNRAKSNKMPNPPTRYITTRTWLTV